jgi:hypothetical protein
MLTGVAVISSQYKLKSLNTKKSPGVTDSWRFLYIKSTTFQAIIAKDRLGKY